MTDAEQRIIQLLESIEGKLAQMYDEMPAYNRLEQFFGAVEKSLKTR